MGAEETQHPIAQILADFAIGLPDHDGQLAVSGIKHVLPLFAAQLPGEFGGILDVDEHDRDEAEFVGAGGGLIRRHSLQ